MKCKNKIGKYQCCSIVCGDAFKLIRKLPDKSVGMVVTDPPYGVGLVYTDGEKKIPDICPYEILPELLRVTNGPVFWFGSATKVVEAVEKFNPKPQRILVWAPAFTTSHVRANGMFYRWQPIYAWQLPKKVPNKNMVHDVFRQTTKAKKSRWNHGGSKPVELIKVLANLGEGTVLDPFVGSGTTAIAARAVGRCFLGFDLSSEYCEIVRERLSFGDSRAIKEFVPLFSMR